ncbi:reverse transcriptase domain-containing protein [Tanacetum coccineum]
MGDADINALTMEQYMALTHGNQALGVVKPKIGGNVNFEIKSQFMRELREYTFSGNKNDEAYEHVERILDIELQRDGWTDYRQEQSTPGICSKMPSFKDLGANVNIMPKSMFIHLKLTNLKETNMLIEMADMTKNATVGIVETVLVKIDKFLFPSDFMIINMLGDPNETMILCRPFIATINARIDVFDKEISLGVRKDRIVLYEQKFALWKTRREVE